MFAPLFLKELSLQCLADALHESPQTIYIEEVFTPAKVLYTAALISKLKTSLLFVVATEEEKIKVLSDFACLEPDLSQQISRHSESFIRNDYPFLGDINKGFPFFIVCTLSQLLAPFPSPDEIHENSFLIKTGMRYHRKFLVEKLVSLGLEKVNQLDMQNQFSLRGDILEVYSRPLQLPVRFLFNDETCERISSMDAQKNVLGEHQEIMLFPGTLPGTCAFTDYLTGKSKCLVVLNEEETLSSVAEGNGESTAYNLLNGQLKKFPCVSFSFVHHVSKTNKFVLAKSFPSEFFFGKISKFRHEMRALEKSGYRIFIFSKEADALTKNFIDENHTVVISEKADLKTRTTQIFNGKLSSGFKLPEFKIAFFSDREIFTRVSSQKPKIPPPRHEADFKPGDYVVHVQFGIGKFTGLTTMQRGGDLSEFALVQYAGDDKLYVPLEQMDRLQKYINGDEKFPHLSRLSSSSWETTKRKVKEKARDVAQELLQLYSVRDRIQGFPHEKDTDMQSHLEDDFEFEETPGQASSILDVKLDMESARVMDRLVCGDVGYGKTEVALRAAFKSVMSGKQVCLLAPTTVLCLQHYRVFKNRFHIFPVNVALLTRFQSKKEQKEILQSLKEGTVDVCIGTHRLLQNDIHFRDIGLVIIDEEQRFGVLQKEKFKNLRKSVDVLTLTATPIPRTLYMSIMNIRDVSLIETPPPDRLAIQTEVAEYDDELVFRAISSEMERGGQVFYVHNNIIEIDREVRRLKKIVPRAKILVVHGKFSGKILEEHMLKFVSGKAHVLVSTTVIENGLDIPNANTLIVNNADKFGLSQLYQLRGRVGRSNRQAYAYFLYNSKALLSGVSRERLAALKEFAYLGSGYELAKRDLEIRGAGNLLGEEQSGFMAQVGFTLYCELLHQAVAELKGEIPEPDEPPAIDFPFAAYIPKKMVENDEKRLYYYRKLSFIQSLEEADSIVKKVSDECGSRADVFTNLIEFVKIKFFARQCGVVQVQLKNGIVKIRYRDGSGKISTLHRNLHIKSAHVYADALRKIFKEINELKSGKDSLNAKEVCVSV